MIPLLHTHARLPCVDIAVIVARTICRIIQICWGKLILARSAARCSGQVSMVRALSADRAVHPGSPRSHHPPHPHHTCGSRSCDVLRVSGDADRASRSARRQRCRLCVKVARKDPGGDHVCSQDAEITRWGAF